MKKPGIPAIGAQVDPRLRDVLEPIRETVQILTGARGGRISQLGTNATTAEIIAKINELLELLQ